MKNSEKESLPTIKDDIVLSPNTKHQAEKVAHVLNFTNSKEETDDIITFAPNGSIISQETTYRIVNDSGSEIKLTKKAINQYLHLEALTEISSKEPTIHIQNNAILGEYEGLEKCIVDSGVRVTIPEKIPVGCIFILQPHAELFHSGRQTTFSNECDNETHIYSSAQISRYLFVSGDVLTTEE